MIRHEDQEGAVAVTVAVMLLSLVAVSMLAIDGGQLFTSRRNVLVDTDAAALAAARHMVTAECTVANRTDAADLAQDVLDDNDPSTTTPTPPAIDCSAGVGRATVSAIRTTGLTFGGIAGIPEVDVAATSVAQYGPVASAEGLRPMALCDKDPHFLDFAFDNGHLTEAEIRAMLPSPDGDALWDLVQQVEADPAEHLTTGPEGPYNLLPGEEVHKVLFSRQSTISGCGSAGGNWGWLDFDGGGGGAQQVRDWIRYGYDHPITVGPGEDCAPEVTTEFDCIGEPGAGGNSWDDALEDIRCPSDKTAHECRAEGKAFPVVLFTSLACTGNGANPCGNGANARYDHVAFVGIAIRDWSSVTGNPNNQSWFGLQFIDPFITGGTITGTPPAIGPGLVSVQLCGGSHGTTTDDYCVVP